METALNTGLAGLDSTSETQVADQTILNPTAQVVSEAAPEVAVEAAPEVVAESTPEVAVEVVSEAAPEVAVEAAPEVVAESTPETTQNEIAPETAQDELPSDPTELLAVLASDIQNLALGELKIKVEAIKVLFYKIVRAQDEAARISFVAAGGSVDDYKAETTPQEARFKELLMLYRTRRDEATQASDEQKAANYAAKLALVEELKALVDSTETVGQTFAAFREIQSRWKEIGIVPIAHTKDLWDTYHHHTENFYNFIKINKELRDLDLKRNYEAKIELCERAEALLENPSATSAFNELQKLHDQYREAGPVVLEFKEQLWERFKAASARINKRHQEHYDTLRVEQETNLALKEGLCAKVEEFASLPLTSVSEWNEVQNQITEVQKVWKTIGFAPKKDNNRIYERFRAACDKFFAAKRNFFSTLRSEMDENLQAKTDLCIMAETLSQSDDWKATTEAIIELQKRWKESGPLSRRHADTLWKRFRKSCDTFFERKSEHFKESDSQYTDNLTAKQIIIEELRALEASAELSFDKLKEVMGRFTGIGFVPIKQKETISKQYKAVVDSLFDKLRSAEGSNRIERFKDRVRDSKALGGRVVNSERDKLARRMKELQGEIATLENNIGFFAKSKNAGTLIQSVEHKIEKIKIEIEQVVAKINHIDQQ